MTTAEVLAAIDRALGDGLSMDAMRWTPDPLPAFEWSTGELQAVYDRMLDAALAAMEQQAHNWRQWHGWTVDGRVPMFMDEPRYYSSGNIPSPIRWSIWHEPECEPVVWTATGPAAPDPATWPSVDECLTVRDRILNPGALDSFPPPVRAARSDWPDLTAIVRPTRRHRG